MATQMFCRLLPKTLIYSRSVSTTSSAISFLCPLSGSVLLPPSFRSLSPRASFFEHIPNCSALKMRNGCDYYPSLVMMQEPRIGFFRRLLRGEPTRDEYEIIHIYVKTLDDLVGSKDEARMMVYRCIIYARNTEYAFGTLVSEKLLDRVQALPGVASYFMFHYQLEKLVRDAIAYEELDRCGAVAKAVVGFIDVMFMEGYKFVDLLCVVLLLCVVIDLIDCIV